MSFVHLHTHSHYSLLDGLTKLDELVEAAKNDGAPAIALTDHGVMYGVIEFYQKCKKAGIKPIIGVEAYLAPNSRFDKTRTDDKNYYHLLLLAKNNQGYKNLIKLTSLAHLEGFYYKPRIDWEILSQYSEGLIGSSACLGGEIPRLILSGKLDRAKQRIREYNDLFGQGNYFLELMSHPNLDGLEMVNETLIKLSEEMNIPLVATNDIHYLRKDDYEAQDILLCLQNKKKITDIDRMTMSDGDYSMRGAKEMIELFSHVPQAIANTLKIAEMCNVEIELGKVQLPYFEVPDGFNGDSYLRHLCEEGLLKRYGKKYDEVDTEIKERMDFELETIGKMGWPSYFLIVADFITWSKNNGIVVGPGRGSAAGSLVCYLTGITNLDPLKYDLLFERFLNPDRISMPDIDMDFADIRRDDVIRYVENKYGKDHVAQIATFGTMAAKAAVKDVGRVLDYPYDYCDKISKAIPMFTKLEKAVDTVSELKDIYKEADGKKIIDFAKRLEGVARHSSVHACGVLITKDPLTDTVPVQFASSSDQTIVSQYSLHPIEDLGLLKMDFLGLKNLTIIESAIRIIKNTRGLEIDIDNLPLDDDATFKLFQDGETTGVFQFESSGMKRYLRELKPTHFEDIIAMVALYRPGPMELIPDYIDRKHGRKKIEYLHPKLEPILKNTYGIAVYQEQVMQMSRSLAGFTKGEADVMRKAMGKKIVALLAEQKIKFIDGCVKNGISSEHAQTIFSFIEPFAGYGFNRSHAACYAMIGYQTAYLKAHWPAEFMAALLTSDQEDIDRIAIEIEECRNMGIKVLPPDINQSFFSFTVVTSGTESGQPVAEGEKVDTIRFGLKAVKNIGGHIAEVIIKNRKENGVFKDITDILERVVDKDLNRKSLEALIKSGALDHFGERGGLLANVDNFLQFNKKLAEEKNSKQASLFGASIQTAMKVKLDPAPAIDRQTKLAWEKELLGLYISDHPFLDYKKHLQEISPTPIHQLSVAMRDRSVRIAGMITTIKKIVTRKNETMLFVKIGDNIANTEILVFPRLLKEAPDAWKEGTAVLIQGKVSDKDSEVKIIADFVVGLHLDKMGASLDEFKKKMIVSRESEKKFNWRERSESRSSFSSGRYPSPTEKKTPASVSAPSRSTEENMAVPLKLILMSNPDQARIQNLKDLLLSFPGESKVYFKVKNGDKDVIMETGFRVANNPELSGAIRDSFGDLATIA